MILFEKSSESQMKIEQKIINTNTEYNWIAYDKDRLEVEDLLKQHQEAEDLKTQRFLIKKAKQVYRNFRVWHV
ncbi:hypothetical protein [Halobacillus andaensis]|uniref:hypothetical protein n=1 Tax=Halobacillus andaensis TaxID=1176239 RepID=UPI003D74DE1D